YLEASVIKAGMVDVLDVAKVGHRIEYVPAGPHSALLTQSAQQVKRPHAAAGRPGGDERRPIASDHHGLTIKAVGPSRDRHPHAIDLQAMKPLDGRFDHAIV